MAADWTETALAPQDQLKLAMRLEAETARRIIPKRTWRRKVIRWLERKWRSKARLDCEIYRRFQRIRVRGP
jgi:hypothetical protein